MKVIIKFTAVGKYDIGTIFKAKYHYDDDYIDFIVIKTEPSAWSENALEVTAEEC